MFEEGEGLVAPSKKATQDDLWGDCIESGTKDGFLERALEINRAVLITRFPLVMAFTDWRYRDTTKEYETPEGMTCRCKDYPELADWV